MAVGLEGSIVSESFDLDPVADRLKGTRAKHAAVPKRVKRS
jgi:hypothetical protein